MAFTMTFISLFFHTLYVGLPLLIVLSLLIVLMGLKAGKLEGWSFNDSLYWSIVTATTVGYGDMTPQNKISRLLSAAIALVGLILTGIMVAAAVNAATIAYHQHHMS